MSIKAAVKKNCESFTEVKARTSKTKIDDVEIYVIGYEDLLKNKQEVNRLKDKLDIEELQKRRDNKSNDK